MKNFRSAHEEGVNTNKSTNKENGKNYDMIVFCHLRWQFVYQRPQHIISRLAKDLKVLFVEEPIGFDPEEENTAILTEVNQQLHVLQPKVRTIKDISNVLSKYVSNSQVSMGWFYSAAFSELLQELNFETIIYDCMDELSLFKGAPQELIDQEKFLISNADIVFTGGKSLYESKKKMHGNAYCFPSSVDESHFAQALNGIEIPMDIAHIKAPVVGYYGVIDERIDLELLHETAEKSPEVSFVMIGPLAKIGDSDLPRLTNIHYLGMKTYDELPAYLKAFDIAMMPFALNDSTKFISPTKTLEYMAAGKPIISTKIKDVVRDYADCVALIENADDFCEAISYVSLGNNSNLLSYKEILANTSWDATAQKMSAIIKQKAL
ncbi:glycosyltransferase [Flavobacterium qiangtangense]|uniref:Glycosyltransferase n=1 Tax=Flavobacterium qiangtangense TaxID=1442595 RepID=A0ABW1PJL3_9FLAO